VWAIQGRCGIIQNSSFPLKINGLSRPSLEWHQKINHFPSWPAKRHIFRDQMYVPKMSAENEIVGRI